MLGTRKSTARKIRCRKDYLTDEEFWKTDLEPIKLYLSQVHTIQKTPVIRLHGNYMCTSPLRLVMPSYVRRIGNNWGFVEENLQSQSIPYQFYTIAYQILSFSTLAATRLCLFPRKLISPGFLHDFPSSNPQLFTIKLITTKQRRSTIKVKNTLLPCNNHTPRTTWNREFVCTNTCTNAQQNS